MSIVATATTSPSSGSRCRRAPTAAWCWIPNEFYILASKEAVQVPPDYAAEMVPFDPLVGEFRVHYAGFFDPGFGYAGAGGRGSRAVLEVRSREVPFILEHGQIVGRLVYEAMMSRPDTLYGQGIGSNYQAQGLKLSKHFRSDALRRWKHRHSRCFWSRHFSVASPQDLRVSRWASVVSGVWLHVLTPVETQA